ncbi:MAG: hypothetical protein KBD16_04310 [Candidatus Pacebacteria bacterium]|nr:hypothetical protein [Candidatus Paceibacterota bacterium]
MKAVQRLLRDSGVNTIELGKVNNLDVRVVYDEETGLFTIKPSYGEISKAELASEYGLGIYDLANMARIMVGRISLYLGPRLKNPEIVPREDPSSTKAEYTFSIEERQVPCV